MVVVLEMRGGGGGEVVLVQMILRYKAGFKLAQNFREK